MFRAILKKEILLTVRDIHALMVLFAMPVAFILVMSLALQDTDAGHKKVFDVAIVFASSADRTASRLTRFTHSKNFRYVDVASGSTDARDGRHHDFIAKLVIPEGFFKQLGAAASRVDGPIQIHFKGTTPLALRQLLVASVDQHIVSIEVERQLGRMIPDPALRRTVQKRISARKLIVQEEGMDHAVDVRPTAVQQSVPAWLIFSMFFVVIPIATTLIIEKQNGTHQRLMTVPVPGVYLLLGKLIPYLIINMVQTILMFLVGIYVVPLLGGSGLVLPPHAWPLIPISLAVGLAAISLALFIATIVKTTEQATTVGGVINLLLGALGGIMVPTYVMPEFMRTAAGYSPMNWGLEGYLTILLGEGNLSAAAANIAKLLGLALVLFALAVANYRRVSRGRAL